MILGFICEVRCSYRTFLHQKNNYNFVPVILVSTITYSFTQPFDKRILYDRNHTI